MFPKPSFATTRGPDLSLGVGPFVHPDAASTKSRTSAKNTRDAFMRFSLYFVDQVAIQNLNLVKIQGRQMRSWGVLESEYCKDKGRMAPSGIKQWSESSVLAAKNLHVLGCDQFLAGAAFVFPLVATPIATTGFRRAGVHADRSLGRGYPVPATVRLPGSFLPIVVMAPKGLFPILHASLLTTRANATRPFVALG